MAGRPAMYPWDTWTDGAWHTAERGVHYRCSPTSFVQALHGRARTMLYAGSERVRVGTRSDGEKISFRFLTATEDLFSEAPEDFEILHGVRRRAHGAEAYPWSAWTDGEWHLAVATEDFTCSPTSFIMSVRRQAEARGLVFVAKALPPGPEQIYRPDRSVVVFRFVYKREDATLSGADEALSHLRRSFE